MKKLLMAAMVAVAAAGALGYSCSADRSKVDEINPATLAEKIRNCTNDDSLKLYVDAAKDYASRLASENKLDSARLYLAEIVPEVTKKDPKLADNFKSVEGVIEGAANSADSTLSALGDKAGEAADSVVSKTKEAASAVADKAGDLKDAAVDKAKELKDAAADKAKQVKDEASEAGKNAADKAKELFGK